jgi:hypothetical protein
LAVGDEKSDDDRIAILLEILEHDRQHVMLYVAVCFGVPVFALSELSRPPSSPILRVILAAALVSFIGAGASYFFYAQRIHWKRLEGIKSIMNRDAEALRESLFGVSSGVWATAGHHYERGGHLLLGGSALFVVYVAAYVLAA